MRSKSKSKSKSKFKSRTRKKMKSNKKNKYTHSYHHDQKPDEDKEKDKNINMDENMYFNHPCLLLNTIQIQAQAQTQTQTPLLSSRILDQLLFYTPSLSSQYKHYKTTKKQLKGINNNMNVLMKRGTNSKTVLKQRQYKQYCIPKSYNTPYSYILKRKKMFTHGTNSKIYKGYLQKTKNDFSTPIIIRSPLKTSKDINKDKDKDKDKENMVLLQETIIQNYIYCQTYADIYMHALTKTPIARIPKILCICKSAKSNELMICMEYIEGDTGFEYIQKANGSLEFTRGVCDMVLQITSLISLLQYKCKFMHRDLHLSNILHHTSEKTKQTTWYIIDFGLAKLDVNDINHEQIQYPYIKQHEYNPTHDLRIFLTAMFENLYYIFHHTKQKTRQLQLVSEVEVKLELEPELEPQPMRIYRHFPKHLMTLLLVKFMIPLLKYYSESVSKSESNTLYWNVYDKVVDRYDSIFSPEHIYQLFQIFKNKYDANTYAYFSDDELNKDIHKYKIQHAQTKTKNQLQDKVFEISNILYTI